MGHGLTETDTMFSVKQKPWHKLGTVLENAPTIKEAIKHAGLEWEVGLKELYTGIPKKSNPALIEIDTRVDAFATYRRDNDEILGVVGNSYKPLQNDEAFEFFQPFLDDDLAELETAGSLFGGKKVFVLAKIKTDPIAIVRGVEDNIEAYVLLSNSHDGKQAVKVGFTPIRVVCNNTLSMAHDSKASKLIRVNHSSKVNENLVNLRETMNLVKQSFEGTAEQYRFLASKQINQSDLNKYFVEIFNLKDETEQKRDPRKLKMLNELFETGRGNHLKGVSGSRWAAYNATTEYLQYNAGRTPENSFGSLWFGPNQLVSKKALETLIKL